jgi:hypothetical protein
MLRFDNLKATQGNFPDLRGSKKVKWDDYILKGLSFDNF